MPIAYFESIHRVLVQMEQNMLVRIENETIYTPFESDYTSNVQEIHGEWMDNAKCTL